MTSPAKAAYGDSVFVNCPFDDQYQPLFQAIVFTIYDCGLVPRCALEVSDSSSVRIDNIYKIMSTCQFGIHDLSRVSLDKRTRLPRFNMPLELGMLLGMKYAGGRLQRQKKCLVLDTEPFRYQQFCSDISGQDIKPHEDDPATIIKCIRHWLRTALDERGVHVASAPQIADRFSQFTQELPVLAGPLRADVQDLTFMDLSMLTSGWLQGTQLSSTQV